MWIIFRILEYNIKTNKTMKNQNTNEKSLLTYLEELREQTISSITKEEALQDYWVSGRYKKDVKEANRATNEEVDFYITNSKNRLELFLHHRLIYIEHQIKQIKK